MTLKNCPFCGSSGDDLIVNSTTKHPVGQESYKLWWVFCSICQCTGPRPSPTRAVAIEAWNQRLEDIK
jgi:hypothetical protein